MTEKPKPLWIVLDKNGNHWGPFDDTYEATVFAEIELGLIGRLAPTADGWQIVALRHPDE